MIALFRFWHSLTFSILVGGKWCIYIHIIAYSWIFMKIIEIPENAIWTYYICSVLHAPAGGGPWSAHRKWRIYHVTFAIFVTYLISKPKLRGGAFAVVIRQPVLRASTNCPPMSWLLIVS